MDGLDLKNYGFLFFLFEKIFFHTKYLQKENERIRVDSLTFFLTISPPYTTVNMAFEMNSGRWFFFFFSLKTMKKETEKEDKLGFCERCFVSLGG